MIKMRLWDCVCNKMLYALPKGFKICLDGNVYYDDIVSTLRILVSTGQTDMYDNDIYEGDVYSVGSGRNLHVVVWHDSGLIGKQVGASDYAGISYWKSQVEVIGNIYENPELTKGNVNT